MTPRRSFLAARAALAALVVAPVEALRSWLAPESPLPIGEWTLGTSVNGAWRFERCRDGAVWNGRAWQERLIITGTGPNHVERILPVRNIQTGRYLRSSARRRRERFR